MNKLIINIVILTVTFASGVILYTLFSDLDDSKYNSLVIHQYDNETPKIQTYHTDVEQQVTQQAESEIIIVKDEEVLLSLRNEVQALQSEINKLQLLEQGRLDKESAKKREMKEIVKSLSSKEARLGLAMHRLKTLKNELKSELSLSAEQSTQLYNSLQDKVERDVETQLLASNQLNSSFSEQILSDRVVENQAYFESDLAEFMSEEQINDYRAFERNKAIEQVEKAKVYGESLINSLIEDLEGHQREAISRYFASVEPDIEEIRVGSYGTPVFDNSFTQSAEEQVELLETLETILSSEQLDYLRKSHASIMTGDSIALTDAQKIGAFFLSHLMLKK